MNYLLLAFSLLATQIAYGANSAPQLTQDNYATEYARKHSSAEYDRKGDAAAYGVPATEAEPVPAPVPLPQPLNPTPMPPAAYVKKLETLLESITPSEMVREFYALLQEANAYEASTGGKNNNRITPDQKQTLSDYAYKTADHFDYIRSSVMQSLEQRTFGSDEERANAYTLFTASSRFMNMKLITETLTLGMINLVCQAAGYRKMMAHDAHQFDSERTYAYLNNTLFTYEKEQLKQQRQPLRLRVKEAGKLAPITQAV